VTLSHCGTGEELFQLLKNALEIRKIVLTNCIADSTDGAANVSGIYNGLQAKTKESVPNHVYIRCDAHALNPVVYDSCTSIPALSLSGLVAMEKLVTSFSDSYKHMHMDAWRDMIVKYQIGTEGQKRLQMISCNTRWSSKSRALTRMHLWFISRSRLICLPGYNPLFDVLTAFKQSKPTHNNSSCMGCEISSWNIG
jgi:hypothetical protein